MLIAAFLDSYLNDILLKNNFCGIFDRKTNISCVIQKIYKNQISKQKKLTSVIVLLRENSLFHSHWDLIPFPG